MSYPEETKPYCEPPQLNDNSMTTHYIDLAILYGDSPRGTAEACSILGGFFAINL